MDKSDIGERVFIHQNIPTYIKELFSNNIGWVVRRARASSTGWIIENINGESTFLFESEFTLLSIP